MNQAWEGRAPSQARSDDGAFSVADMMKYLSTAGGEDTPQASARGVLERKAAQTERAGGRGHVGPHHGVVTHGRRIGRHEGLGVREVRGRGVQGVTVGVGRPDHVAGRPRGMTAQRERRVEGHLAQRHGTRGSYGAETPPGEKHAHEPRDREGQRQEGHVRRVRVHRVVGRGLAQGGYASGRPATNQSGQAAHGGGANHGRFRGTVGGAGCQSSTASRPRRTISGSGGYTTEVSLSS